MALEKYKLCPACGTRNPPSLLECRECETDLTGVKPVDESTEQKEPETPAAVPEGPVRVCECGAHNPPQARKCASCGEDISDILPTVPETPAEADPVWLLTSPDGSFSFELKETSVIGREAVLQDYLADKTYVSRSHARFIVGADGIFVENLSQTNRTYLNDILIDSGTPVALREGDEIGLGGRSVKGSRQEKAAYFILGVRK